MRTRSFGSVVLVVLLATTTLALASAAIDPHNPPQGRFSDDWAEIHLAGKKVGYAHATMAREGDLIHSTNDTVMRLGRADQPVSLSIVEKTTETLAGEPRSFESAQELSIQKTITKGTVRDGKVTIVTSQFGMDRTQTFDFPTGALLKTWGSFRETLLRGFKPGTQYTLLLYEPALRLDGPLTTTTRIGEMEDFSHQGKTLRGQKVTMNLESPMGDMELVSWIDREGKPLKARMPAPGIGDLEVFTVDQATALSDFVPPELFTTTTVKAKRAIDPKSARRIRYKVSTTHPDTVIGDLPATGMQTIGERTDKSVEVIVTRQRHRLIGGDHSSMSNADLAEFLDGNLMINTADPQLIELARQAADGEKEPFALGDKLRRFVSDYVKTKNLTVGFATASEVARTREGDCSEHGILLAALGRLNGLPSRVAVGVAYVPNFGNQENIFGYHLWTQFHMNGRWVDFDAALNESDCSPTRIAFATSSLKNAGLADLSLPLLKKIGGIDIDILEIELLTPSK